MRMYLVGGSVRDHLIDPSIVSHDIDFAVEAESYEAMFLALVRMGVTIYKPLPKYVTIRGGIPYRAVAGKYIFPRGWSGSADAMIPADFTLCREETMYSDKRHPDVVTPASLNVDLSRRDFTMNALAMTEDGDIIDRSGGMEDIKDKLVRCVGNPRERFLEDPLRILRAVRFMVKLGFHPDNDLENTLRYSSVIDGLSSLPVERVQDEMNRAMRHSWRETMLLVMVRYPLLGDALNRWFDSLWFKATTEDR